MTTETRRQCAHEACTCEAPEDQFCSDHCRTSAGQENLTCACGHKDCAGTIEAAESAVG